MSSDYTPIINLLYNLKPPSIVVIFLILHWLLSHAVILIHESRLQRYRHIFDYIFHLLKDILDNSLNNQIIYYEFHCS